MEMFHFERRLRRHNRNRGEVRKGGEAPLRVTYRAITRRNSVMEGKRIMGLWRFSSPMVVTVPP
jgi:hypothetical protein